MALPKTGLAADLTTVLGAPGGRHVIVQFSEPVAAKTRAALESSDIKLLRYLGSNAYFARTSGGGSVVAAAQSANASAAYEIQADWKLHPRIATDTWPPYAVFNAPGSALGLSGDAAAQEVETAAVYVMFHPDVDLFGGGAAALARHGGVMQDYMNTANAVVAWLPRANVRALAAEDAVAWIEPPLPPLEGVNDSNRTVTQANQVQAAPYGLDGTGVNVLIYDGGAARASHVDFGGRLTVRDASGMDDHPTHVAGTVGGSGAASGGLYRGMAPGVTIQSYGCQFVGSGSNLYDDPGDLEHDYNEAMNTYGAVLANSSIGTNTAQNGLPCDWEGNYGVTDSVIDAIVAGSLGSPMRIVWANGNERGNGRCGTLYHTTAPPACAKNSITVGALNSNDDSMTVFSSWGPTDDGRIKPDVSGPGCQSGGDGGVTSCFAGSDTEYGVMCGTSMAAPTVTGLCALVLQDYKVQFPAAPLPRNSTMKVLLAHNAVDLGNAGPDYKYGYGSVRVKDTIDFMRRKSFFEASIDQGEENLYFVPVISGTASLKVTVAWDDPPGAVNTIPELVNDLDVVAVEPNGTTIHYPWTLDPANPGNPAVRTGADHVNNSEQVVVDAPAVGTWTIKVIGHAVAQGPQVFSLGTSPNLYNCTPAGVISLDKETYGCGGVARITVNDCDLDTNPDAAETVNVTVNSTTQPGGEFVTLTETGVHTATFANTLQLSAVAGPGALQVGNGDTVTAVYIDASDGQGHSNVSVTDTATVDCQAPIISNVQVIGTGSRSATITFDTNEAATGSVRCAQACGGPYPATGEDLILGTSHTVVVSGLSQLTTYNFVVDATDAAGNGATNDNGGSCYAFTTPEQPDYFTELFSSADNDLGNETLYFTPNGSSSFYHACREAAASFPTDPAGGTDLPLGDDSPVQVNIAGGQRVWLYGISYTTFFVGPNGYVTFGSGDASYAESLSIHFSLPRISALFEDLDLSSLGTVSWKQLSDRVVVTFENVPQRSTSNSNNFQVQMFFDGSITITHLAIAAQYGLVGLSAGAGVPADFIESDLSAYGPCDALGVSPGTPYTPAGYQGGPFAISSTVYTLTNNGAAALNWTASGTQAWLDVAPAGGPLNPGSVNVTVSLNAGVNALVPGTYADTVTITNTTSGYVCRRAVELTVRAIPGEIDVTDSIPPGTDLAVPFGNVITGMSRTEHVTVANLDGTYPLIVTDVSLGGSAVPGSLSTLFAAGNGFAGSMFDVEVSEPLTIAGFDVNLDGLGTVNTIEVYYRPDTSVGHEGSSSGWTLLGSDTNVVSNGEGVPTPVAVGGLALSPGQVYGLYINMSSYPSASLRYTNGGPTVFSNAEMSLTTNCGNASPAFTGGMYYPRQWNGTVHYQTGTTALVQKCLDKALSSADGFRIESLPAFPATVPPGGALIFDVIYAPVAVGSGTANVFIDSNDSDEPTVKVALTGGGILDDLTVTPAGAFMPTGSEGGPFTPSSTIYAVTNSGAAPLNWTAGGTQPWLDVAPAGGPLLPGSSVNVTVSLNAGANALAPGPHTDTVTITNTTSGFASPRAVELTAVAIPGVINVRDSIPPVTDLALPFGDVITGLSRTEHITVGNWDLAHALVISRIALNALYSEDFNDGLAQGWVENPEPDWEVVGQEYRAQSASETWMQSTYTAQSWDNADVRATIRRTGNTNTAMLFLRASNDFNRPVGSGSALAVGISSDGEYWVIRYVAGSPTWLQQWTLSPYLNTGTAPNVVQATVNGTEIKVYFNGNMAWTGTDPSTASGRIGLAGYTTGAFDPVHYFDEVTVGEPGSLSVTGAAMNPEQAWHNSHPVTGGTPETAPNSEAFAAYPGPKSALTLSVAGVATSGPNAFQLANVPPMPHTIAPGGSFTFDMIYAPSAAGPDMATVFIDSNDSDEPTVEVALTGNGILDALMVMPAGAFTAAGPSGGPFTPAGRTYTLVNSGGSALNWHASATQPWVTFSPTSGTLPAGASVGVDVVLNANANSLPAGDYLDTAAFVNEETGGTVTRGIELGVGAPPTAPVNPTPSDLATGVHIDAKLSWEIEGGKRLGAMDGVRRAVDAAIGRSGILNGAITAAPGDAANPFNASRGTAPVAITEPSRIANVLTAAEAGTVAASSLNVAVYGAETQVGWLPDVQAKLMATGQFNSVSVFDVSTFTPGLAEVQAFDAVLILSDANYADNLAMGNVMADYAAGGGGVVCSMFELGDWGSGGGVSMQGRWPANGYVLMDRSVALMGQQAGLGVVHDPTHPIMNGVATFDGGSYSVRPAATTVYPGATVVAEWSDGHPLVVTADVNGARRADIGFFPVSGDAYAGLWNPATDGAKLMANALTYVVGGASGTSYDVYMGTSNPPRTLLRGGIAKESCDPGVLNDSTTYYWQVVAKNLYGTVQGPVWRFATLIPPSLRLDVPAPLYKALTPGGTWMFDPGLGLCNDGGSDLNYSIAIRYSNPVRKSDTMAGVRASVDAAIQRSGILNGPITATPGAAANSSGGGSQQSAQATITEPSRIANVRTAAEAGVQTASSMNVVVCGADGDPGYLEDVQAKLTATGQFNSVSIFDVSTFTPSLAEVQAFNAVLVFSNYAYADPVAMGNVMADYAAGGGGVVCSMWDVSGWSGGSGQIMQGRWVTNGLLLMDRLGDQWGQAGLGVVHDPAHPVMNGVTSFDGGSGSPRPVTTAVHPGVNLVAEWSDGHPLVATANVGGARRADLGFFPVSADVVPGLWNPATDGAKLMANALTWVGGGGQSWLMVQQPQSGAVAVGTCENKLVRLDSAGLAPGTYRANIVVTSDDPLRPDVTVPARLDVGVHWLGFSQQPVGGRRYTGEAHTLSVQADGGPSALHYQWKFDDGSKAVNDMGTDAPTFTIPSLDAGDEGSYWCVVQCDGVGYPSEPAVIVVRDHLAITQALTGGAKAVGDSHTFTVETSGGHEPLAYLWSKGQMTLLGEHEASCALLDLDEFDSGTYRVEVSDAGTDILTASAELTVGIGLPLAGLAGLGALAGLFAVAGARMRKKQGDTTRRG